VLIRIAHAASLPTLDDALRSLEEGASAALPARAGSEGPSSAAPSAPGGDAQAVSRMTVPSLAGGNGGGSPAMRLVETAQEKQTPEPAPQARPVVAEAADAGPRIASLADICALASANREMALKVLVKRCVRPVRIEPGRLDVSLTPDAPVSLLNDLSNKLLEWTGRRWIVSLSREEGGATLAEMENERRESAIMDARSDPTVAAVLSSFPGARIIDVRIREAVAQLDGDGDAELAPDPGIDPEADDDDDI
jgi:DNA polymerase III subunit gamma/tau